ncbi:MAG: PilN domain-containing protein [Candidatus Aminicenantes bacterium]|nr:PilN domain-containing protein [Candidatus Aminicenantes bacterium]
MNGIHKRSAILAAPGRDLLILAAACCILVGTAVWHQSLDSRTAAGETRLAAIGDGRGRLEAVLKRVRRWEEAIENLIRCRDRVQELKIRQASPLSLWNRLMDRFPSGEEVSLHRLDWEDETLTLEGTAATPSAAGTLLDRLDPGAGFYQVELRALEQTGNTVRFAVTARTGH